MTRSTQLCLLSIVVELFATSSVFSGDASRQQPDLAALVRAGRETTLRLQRQAASWTAITHLRNDARVVVKILSTPTMRRTVVYAQFKERKLGELQIIARDKLWYVTELGRRKKYRPFEAPFLMNAAYFFLLRGALTIRRGHSDRTKSILRLAKTADSAATRLRMATH
jgi:hypothetical protein